MAKAEDEYRIEFTVQRCLAGEEEFTEVGFGTSGSWTTLDMCAHMVSTAIQTDDWETEPGQPDPRDVRAHERAQRDAD